MTEKSRAHNALGFALRDVFRRIPVKGSLPRGARRGIYAKGPTIHYVLDDGPGFGMAEEIFVFAPNIRNLDGESGSSGADVARALAKLLNRQWRQWRAAEMRKLPHERDL